MQLKKLMFCVLTIVAITAKAQLTYSYTIPNPIPEYDGTYENFGQGHLFYPNEGEIRLNDDDYSDALDYVKYYTMYTNPKQYLLLNNNISLCYSKGDAAATTANGMDTLQRIDIEWDRSNGSAFLARVDTQKFGRLFYFDQYFGSSGGRTVEGGAAIACQSIYNNIDLVYTSNNAGLVMYFIVYPGGNYKDIFLHFNGSNSSSIIGNDLVAQGSWTNFTLRKPKMYQYTMSGSVITPVNVCNANWINSGTDTYQINNATAYNASLPLIIQIKQEDALSIDEPGLCWSTYFGGWTNEFMTRTHTDANDNLYIAGTSNSTGNTFPQAIGITPVAPQGNDGVISKFNPSGVLQWSAFMGGSSNEDIRDFDFSGNSIFCVGRTASSSSFPTLAKTGAMNDATFGGGTGPWDGFIYEFEFDPILQTFTPKWLTYFGGNDWDDLYGCKIDGSGNLYIVGASSSSDMSIQANSGGYLQNFNTAQLNSSTPISTDAIIGKFNSNGSINWFTFFGADLISGSNPYSHAADYFYGITLAGSNVYACGKSGGTNLPGAVNGKFVGGQFDGILANFSNSGVLTASKYTDGNIANYAVKEIWGEVYTAGEANSSMTPVNSGLWYYNGTAPGGNTDACFSIHTSNLSATTTHNSFLGGNAEDAANDIQFSANNLLLISGNTHSSNFPITSLGSMYQQSFAGGINDNFIAAFQKSNSNILWSTCLGSNINESNDFPPFINSAFDLANTTISIDSQNRLRLLGSTNSGNTFPLDDGNQVPYFQATTGGGFNDASITCFDMEDLSSIVGLNDFPNTQFSFGLYPNPTAKNLTITNASLFVNEDLRYAIYDVSGKKLQAGNLRASEAKNIDVSTLSQGIYIINVSDGKKTVSNKFVKTND